MSNSICIIPARAGSKRIPGKNTRLFCGQPILSRSVQTAIKSGLFKSVIVSTDSQEIANVALQAGATVPFLRPESLADDFTGTKDVITHAITSLRDLGFLFRDVCCLYATSPFTTIEDLRYAYKLLGSVSNLTFVFAATSYAFPIQRALALDDEGYAYFLDQASALTRSQDLVNTYHDAGQFYWGSSNAWLTSSNILDKSKPIFIPRSRAQDIDTPEDWEFAELLYQVARAKNLV